MGNAAALHNLVKEQVHMDGSYTLECSVDSVESAICASKGGATRFELCGNLIIGGTTPDVFLFREIRKLLDIPIRVLLRPRFGDFLYSDYEMSVLKQNVDQFREEGADGIVIGCLTKEGELDIDKMKQLIERSGDMKVTLHRAFDVCANPIKALKQAEEIGISTILTSGQKNHCLEGRELLAELLERAAPETEILIGAGVSAEAIDIILKEMPAISFHMSGKVVLDSEMRYRKQHVNMGIPSHSEYEIWRTDTATIAAAKDVLEQYKKYKDAEPERLWI